ncbi:MAG: SOS response-associated peptidase [Asticcacaulis sp.]
MCGHFETLRYLKLLRAYALDVAGDAAPHHIAPSVPAPVLVYDTETSTSGVAEARFGLVPFWYRGALKGWKASTFNARVEEAPLKRAFQGPWKYRRCVVPADTFYEWSGPKANRRKWRISRGDNQPLAFAGLWDEAACADGDVLSFCILTRPAGDDMAAIHDREPVILPQDDWEPWMRLQNVDLRAPAPLRIVEDAPQGQTLSLF